MGTPPFDRRPGAGDIVATALIGVWIVGATVGMQLLTWAVEQFLLVEGLAMPAWAWPLACWINAVLIAVPSILLFAFGRRATVRAAGKLWTIAGFALGLLGSVRAVPPARSELYYAIFTLVGAVLALFAVRLPMLRSVAGGWTDRPRQAAEYRVAPGRIGRWDARLLGAAVGLAVLLPWLWVGALGGALESVLALLAAATVGLLGAAVLNPVWRAYRGAAIRPSIVCAGLVAGVALIALGAGTGGSGPHLAEGTLLPPLGFVAAALGLRARQSKAAVAILLGIAALGPLAFVEAEETTITIGLHDVAYWTAIAGGISLAVGLIAAAITVVTTGGRRRRPGITAGGTGRSGSRARTRPRTVTAAALAGVLAAACAVVYPLAGHPGFYGEHLFVVMKHQADLSGLAAIPDRNQRLRATYQRLVDTANTTQAALRATLRRDGLAFTPYYLVDGIEVDGDALTRIWLSRRSDVDRVLLNPRLRPIPSAGPPLTGDLPAPTGPEWNITLIGADRVWASGDTGQGIVIGSSDTGVDADHPALRAAYRGGDDSWYDPWNGTTSPVDHIGHGTHTVGSAVGSGGIGVAPGAQWMACVNLDRDLGNPAYYLDCLQFMLAPFPRGGDPFTDGDPTRAPDILTNSWGCPPLEGCDARALEPAVDALTAAGIFFVAAAGNEGPRCRSIDDAPAPYAAAFTVGAVDRNRTVTAFSSRGPVGGAAKPDVVAPGEGVVSALPGGAYGALDGTSMATPQVAGVVALMWSASPALRGNVAATAAILRDTATPAVASDLTLGAGCDATDQTGAGLVDAVAAVAAARAVK